MATEIRDLTRCKRGHGLCGVSVAWSKRHVILTQRPEPIRRVPQQEAHRGVRPSAGHRFNTVSGSCNLNRDSAGDGGAGVRQFQCGTDPTDQTEFADSPSQAVCQLVVVRHILRSGWAYLAGQLRKNRGAFGKFVRIAEDVAVGLIYLMIGANALTPNGSTASLSELHVRVVQASIFSDLESSTVILILAALISLMTMMLTRLALDVFIWLSPVPFIDLIFETCKVIFSLAFLAIYFFLSPLVAAIMGLLLLVPCFILLPWAVRLLQFGYRIVVAPILAQFSPTFVLSLIEPDLARTVGGSDTTMACRAFVLKARGFKRREAVTLSHVSGRRTVRPHRAKRRTRSLSEGEEQVLLGRALAWIELRVVNRQGQVLDQFALPLSMMKDFDRLLLLLGASDGGDFGAMKVLRTMGMPERVSSS